jgi:DNA mismatch repair ATPase MutS
MFESEVRFAASLLKKRDGPGLVLFDELFHSTNPPDGIRTASCFLKNLWKKSNIASIVSTHVFELVEEAPNSIQKLCVPGVRKEDGTFSFSYKLQPGICTLSSVELIWKQEGLKCG